MLKNIGRVLLTFGIVFTLASPLSSVAAADVSPLDCNGKGSCIPIIDRP